MNITYVLAGAEVVFAAIGIVFGWISGAEGSALILAGLGVFGARIAQPTSPTVSGLHF